MKTIYDPQSSEACYYYLVGPVAVEIPNLEWQSAYRIDLEKAVSVNIDEFKEIASGFDIPKDSFRDGVPGFIQAAYQHLVTRTERNDGQRAVHQRKS